MLRSAISRVCRYGRSDLGNVGIMFALSAVPLLGAVGVAVDYLWATKTRSELQVAADAAALAAAQAIEADKKARRKTGKKIFYANLPQGHDGPQTVKIKVTDEKVTVTAKTDQQTSLMGLFGIKDIKVKVRSIAALAKPGKMEVSMVLDYSGSMNRNGKYQAMRSAAIDLIENLTEDGANNTVKFALVPFSQHVFATLPSEHVIGGPIGGVWTGCTKDRRWPHNTRNTTPLFGNDFTKWGDPTLSTTWTNAHGDGYAGSGGGAGSSPTCNAGTGGYGGSGGGGDDDDDDDDDSSAPLCSYNNTSGGGWTNGIDPLSTDIDPNGWIGWGDKEECKAYVDRNLVTRPLSDDYPGIIAQLNAMRPYNLTHISVGLAFGYHTVSSNAPFTQAAPDNNGETQKVIVLLTDGEPTVAAWGPNNRHRTSQVNDNVETLCSNIKADNILMITVAFDLDDGATKDRLRNCASGAKYFFDASGNTQLSNAFEEITKQLAGPVRLLK